MKRFLIFVILLLSLSAVFATEEQVFSLLDTLTKERPTTHERLTEIFQENMFIPLPPEEKIDVVFQNYFGNTRVKVDYLILPGSTLNNGDVVSIKVFFFPESDKDFTEIVQKIITYMNLHYSKVKLSNYENSVTILYEKKFHNEVYRTYLIYSADDKDISLGVLLFPKQN